MYIQLNSQIISYEKTGEGSPVILLHGNGEDHHIFDALAETMSADHTVYAMDSRGHGESATPKAYHYKDMASDVINLIEGLEIDHPVIFGFSDGGIIALLAAIKRSDLLRGIICCGANLSPDGLTRKALHEIKKLYKTNKDPRTLLMLEEPDIKPADLSAITVPALIFAGENDMVKEKETAKIAANIPDSKVQIFKNQDHSSYIVGSDKIYKFIKDFL